MTSYSNLSARDGNRILRFLGWEVAHSSSARPGVERWSELTLYRTAGGEYILQKVGRSTIAHDPECRFVNHRMPSWLEAREEGKVPRTACMECQPAVGDLMDPHTRLEPQRYTVLRTSNYEEMVKMLEDGRAPREVPFLVKRLIEQAQSFEEALMLAKPGSNSTRTG